MDTTDPIDPGDTLPDKAKPHYFTTSELLDYFRLNPTATVQQAADEFNTSSANIARRLSDPLAEAEYYRIRGYAYHYCDARARALSPIAIDTLGEVLQSPLTKPSDKINAAKAIAELADRYHKIVVILPQLAALKAELYLALDTNYVREGGPHDPRTRSAAPTVPAAQPAPMPTESPDAFAPDVLNRLKDIINKFDK